MKQSKNLTLIIVFSMIILSILIVALVSARSFLGKQPGAEYGFNKTLNAQINAAIKNNDYTTWKSLMESQLTQENFNKLVEFSKNMTDFKQNWNFTNSNFNRPGIYRNFNGTRPMHPMNFTIRTWKHSN